MWGYHRAPSEDLQTVEWMRTRYTKRVYFNKGHQSQMAQETLAESSSCKNVKKYEQPAAQPEIILQSEQIQILLDLMDQDNSTDDR